MRRSVQVGDKIEKAVGNLMSVVGAALSDPRSVEKMMSDDNVAVLKQELMYRYGCDKYVAGKWAGFAVKQLYQPSMKLLPKQWLWLIENKVKYPPHVNQFHAYINQARIKMFMGSTYKNGNPIPPLVNEWISEARKQ